MNDPKFWATVIVAAMALYGQNQLYQWRVKKLEDGIASLYAWKDDHVKDYERHKARCPVQRHDGG